MNYYKYIILTDLDGTLLNSKEQLSQATIDYVQELNDRGDVLFAFSTGRQWGDAEPIYEQLVLQGFVSCCNSAYIYNPHTGKKFYSFLSPQMCVSLLTSALMLEDLQGGTIMTEKNAFTFDKNNAKQVILEITDNALDIYNIKLLYKDTTTTMIDKLNEIKSHSPSPTVTLFNYPGLKNVEIQASHVCKENAVIFFSNYYGVSPENILTFGDHQNDLSVMEGMSTSFAVANALDIIKVNAKHVSKFTNDENAVIKELQNFFKNK